MELKDIINTLKKNLILILATVFVCALVAFMAASKMPSGFTKSQTFVVVPKEQKDDNFRGFYQQEKSRNFTDTAVAILENQNTGISAQKVAPQIIRITASGQEAGQAEQRLKQVVTSFNETLLTLQQTDPLELKAITQASSTAKVVIDARVITIFGAVVGLAVAALTIGAKFYLKL